ncbi:quercetin 2,3-dioxygenase [Lujinxingia litoralis]|uniref:Quercetin 2,3-dioxygenase n=1 Tax=Lujinxingia litoralis TaxID=2211119 RepID=A0A328CA08_9DELT|nr:pirin family protein [Lujinxingia litoralis]RAL25305.1 quercetin 2,3-dioxygenase [Lujinxingia litoralis]
MLQHFTSHERGTTRTAWLNSRHTFSFGAYHNPERSGFRALRVINDDIVSPGAGFDPHPHRDMEIISYVVEGELVHRDSMGNGSTIGPGEVQRMSAGTGVRHSEFNGSDTQPVRFLQIWLPRDTPGLSPSYEQKSFDLRGSPNTFHLIAAPQVDENALSIHQDVRIVAAYLTPGHCVTMELDDKRHAWVQVVKGTLTVNDQKLSAGDSLAASQEPRLTFEASEDAEVLLFDLA